MTNGTAIAQRPAARANLAGVGVSALLIAAAVAAFGALGTFVAFNGLPFAGHGGGTAQVMLRGEHRAGAGGAAANPAARTTRASAAGGPASATAAGARPGATGSAPSGGAPAGGPNRGSVQAGGGAATEPAGGSGSSTAPPAAPAPTSPPSGVAGGTLDNADSAASNLGINTNLGSTAAPITKPGDDAVNGVLNGAGTAGGDPKLGDQTSKAVNGLTGGLVGNGL